MLEKAAVVVTQAKVDALAEPHNEHAQGFLAGALEAYNAACLAVVRSVAPGPTNAEDEPVE